MSEIYGSSSHDTGNDSYQPGNGSFGSGWGGPWRPDYSAYDRGYQTDQPDHTSHDSGQDLGEDDEPNRSAASEPDRAGHADPDHDPDEGNGDAYSGHDPDSPDDWARYLAEYPAEDDGPGWDDDTDAAADSADELDLWGDVDPDAANYADIDTGLKSAGADTPRAGQQYPATSRDAPTGTDSRQDSSTTSTTDRAAEADDNWRQRVAELETKFAQLSETVAEVREENAQVKAENTEVKAENAEIKAENAQVKAENARVNAENARFDTVIEELHREVAGLEARFERVEQGSADKPAEEISDRAHAGEDADSERSEHRKERRGPSDEALLFGAGGIGSALTTAPYLLSYIRPDIANITASLLATSAAGVAWMHKRREARNADRPKD